MNRSQEFFTLVDDFAVGAIDIVGKWLQCKLRTFFQRIPIIREQIQREERLQAILRQVDRDIEFANQGIFQ